MQPSLVSFVASVFAQLHTEPSLHCCHFSGFAVQISTFPSFKNKSGNTLPCWLDLDPRWALHQQSPKEWQSILYSTCYLLPPDCYYFPIQTSPDCSFRAGGMFKEGSREELRTGPLWWVCPLRYGGGHLLVSQIPSAYPSSTPTIKSKWPIFSPGQW